MDISYERTVVHEVLDSLKTNRNLLHILVGPRQVGKTTAAIQISKKWPGQVFRESADQPLPPGPEWIRTHWDRAAAKRNEKTLLILDEVQKVLGWSEVVKSLWDSEQTESNPIKVLLLGSSSLLMQQGLSESLSGRFLLFRCSHWDYREMNTAFQIEFKRWIFFGGYPGSVPMMDNQELWAGYIRDSLIETVISRDVLQLQTVAKPSLLRHLFYFAASAPAQVVSYNKMLGQLVDAGNTTTLAHYLHLLGSAYLLRGLEKFRGGTVKKRGSSPKLVLLNNALVTGSAGYRFDEALENHIWWGRLVENAVGAYIFTSLQGLPWELMYWREGNAEVDYVVQTPRKLLAIEVKSKRPRGFSGLKSFCERWKNAVPVVIGPGGIPLEEFFTSDPRSFLQ